MRRLLATLAIALATAGPASAAEPKASFVDIEDEVMCVSCNVVLNIAESPQADRQRALIRRLVDEGLTKEQIKDRLVDEYSSNVLALPDDDGFGLAAYLVPIVVGIAVVAALLLLVPRWRRRSPAATLSGAAPAGGELGDADAQRLAEDLARYES